MIEFFCRLRGDRIIPAFILIFSIIQLSAHSTNCKQNNNNVEKQSFDDFKYKMLSELQEHIKLQDQHPTYQREKLSLVTDEISNRPIGLDGIDKPPKGIEFYSKSATFYAYNAEGIRDYGWGCAWRAIQTSLSSYGIKTSFANLFHLFGPLQNLQRIYKDKYPGDNLHSSEKFSPYEISSGWAEPFIGEMVMHFYGISSNLESINGIPNSCNAPHSVFHNPPITFAAFKKRLENHFQSENVAPVMIDDGTFAFNIIGIGCKDSNVILWIADPHIKEGTNRYPNGKTPNGLYLITLNRLGEQIECSLDDGDQHQKPNMFREKSYKELFFNNKFWMVLFPSNKRKL